MSIETLQTPQPVHFHAPHKTPAHAKVQRPDAGQRVWAVAEVQTLFDLPFNDLMFQAQTVHRAHFDTTSDHVVPALLWIREPLVLAIESFGFVQLPKFCCAGSHARDRSQDAQNMACESELGNLRQVTDDAGKDADMAVVGG